jgi:hypothetical protein
MKKCQWIRKGETQQKAEEEGLLGLEVAVAAAGAVKGRGWGVVGLEVPGAAAWAAAAWDSAAAGLGLEEAADSHLWAAEGSG